VPSLWREADRVRNQLEDLLGTLSGAVESRISNWAGVYPPLNLSEDADNLYLTAELPGLASADLELSVETDSLTLRGERKLQTADQKVNYHRKEREAGFFRRVVSLPVQVEADQAKASLSNGILTVTLPKAAAAKPRAIAIKAE